jgi:phosphatidylethanolamine/phosphatidyl-N-methylethanolamine N-methyltransferase
MHMREETTSSVYDFWAWFYDHTFGLFVRKKQRRAVDLLRLKNGDRVLDLGVGTGLTLGHYPSDTTVIGMDLSRGMLQKAQKRIDKMGLSHCHLVQGDALSPPFGEASFDHVLITHVISVVSDPPKLLQLAQQMVKPGGKVIVLNHFQSTRPAMAWLEEKLNPLFVKIGWKSDLAMEDVLQSAGLNVDYVYKDSFFDLWRIIVLSRPIATANKLEQANADNLSTSDANKPTSPTNRPGQTSDSPETPYCKGAPLAIDGI